MVYEDGGTLYMFYRDNHRYDGELMEWSLWSMPLCQSPDDEPGCYRMVIPTLVAGDYDENEMRPHHAMPEHVTYDYVVENKFVVVHDTFNDGWDEGAYEYGWWVVYDGRVLLEEADERFDLPPEAAPYIGRYFPAAPSD